MGELDILWNIGEEEVQSFDIDVPLWIDRDIDCGQVAAIIQGGCDSGAYMPAVTYWQAQKTMNDHGDDVLDYLDDYGCELDVPGGKSWPGIAVYFLSCAVELWASCILEELTEAIEDREEEEEEEEVEEVKLNTRAFLNAYE